ncbi:MAG: phospho-sugar mutase [Gorillibacterium sp.]|nr:phospho-sugar mutase [Gorillibacterium sp.]
MTANERIESNYRLWIDKADEGTQAELNALQDQAKEIEDRFYRDLEFGTGGMRGVIGAGTNRMNLYTVGRASQGLAQYLLKNNSTNKAQSVAIAYDSRNQSPEFSLEAALVLAANGITAHVFESLRPTPELSFAVRELGCSAGIVVTASHNPPEYNGYKVYGPDGGQMVSVAANAVIAEIESLDMFSSVLRITRAEAEGAGLLLWHGEDVDRKYIDAVIAVSPNPEIARELGERVKIVFTPLHGAGNLSVRRVLQEIGFNQVYVVPEQELPDALFSTVKSPNPEEKAAFTLAVQLGKQVDADIILGTDPDCDRMGAVVRDAAGEYNVLSGNQSGAIMVNYLLSSLQERGAIPANGVVIKTIVTSEMGAEIARSFGVKVIDTLTGFKYIGERMTEFERTGEHSFLFGYEESYGYLAGNYARDKDAVIASMLICEAAAYYKKQGKTLYDVLVELYEKHGFFMERLESRTLKGLEGLTKIRSIMDDWRANPPVELNGLAVSEILDYSLGIQGLPRENVLKYVLEGGSWFTLRPSGTEPKIKVYYAVKGGSVEESTEMLDAMTKVVMARVDG